MEPERRALGIPSHWLSHVSVESADATAARADELGEETFGGAFDVGDVGGAGWMALVRDAACRRGACGLGAGAHVRARRVNDVGCMTWNELHSREPEEAATFYSYLFGWETEAHVYEGRMAYVTTRNTGSENGGVMPMTEAHGDGAPALAPALAPVLHGRLVRRRHRPDQRSRRKGPGRPNRVP